MKIIKNYSLKSQNSFAVNSICQQIFFPNNLSDLKALPNLTSLPFYILGAGSNTLFTDTNTPTIICPNFKGIVVKETADNYIVTVGASEVWHELVVYCLNAGMNGLENLALIPGNVGAAPVQNIGAYGVEFANYCRDVSWFDFKTQEVITLDAKACQFSYRESVFKNDLHNKGIITQVTLVLPKQWSANLSYQGLNELPKNSTADIVMEKVISLRESKLPDPKTLPNAGSFFKNPVVDRKTFNLLCASHNTMPYYPQVNGDIKLAAAWLIEQSGLKGYKTKGVGVHENQALVLVNYNSDKGSDIVALAKYVQHCVYHKFSILLQPEVKMVSRNGEVLFEDVD